MVPALELVLANGVAGNAAAKGLSADERGDFPRLEGVPLWKSAEGEACI